MLTVESCIEIPLDVLDSESAKWELCEQHDPISQKRTYKADLLGGSIFQLLLQNT